MGGGSCDDVGAGRERSVLDEGRRPAPAATRPVFVHVNKTAGTSIVAAAGDHIVDAGHRTAERWIAAHGRGAPLFSVVRHPYDRVCSEYRYRRGRWVRGEDNPHLMNLVLELDDWVVATFEDGEYRTREFFERTGVPFTEHQMVDDTLMWFLPQSRWLSSVDGELLVDDLLRFERLDEDWARFGARHGFSRPLVHLNASPRRPGAPDRLGARARAVVREHHRVDFDRFGFAR